MVKLSVSLIPVFIFLIGLVFLDSYKLIAFRKVILAILAGCLAAVISLLINSRLIEILSLDIVAFSKYAAPAVEEFLKALYIIYLVKRKRIGFMVDAAIYGFAIGAGFGFAENFYYLRTLDNSHILLWIVRGFGTAVMHGGTMAIFGIITKNLVDRRNSTSAVYFIPGLIFAILIHTAFNLFILSPVLNTVLILIVLPLVVAVVFYRSEMAVRDWLELGLDTDVELLEMIVAGDISETNVGRYLASLKQRFPGRVVADMLCYLRLYLELAIKAKGILMMRNAGFKVPLDMEIKSRLDELKYLEKSIGKTGRLTVSPLLHSSSREIWQLQLLKE